MSVRFTAEMYIDYYASQRGLTVEDLGAGEIAVVSWAPRVIHDLAEATGAELATNWPRVRRRPFYTTQVGERRVTFAEVGIGAPATVAEMEDMIAAGTRAFIGLGWAGSLDPAAPIGTCLIPTSCISEEGTSRHYVEDGTNSSADPALANALVAAASAEGAPVVLGSHWTTDAPYREFIDKIVAYGERGVLGVDMETSAMYALGEVRGVAVCNLLVISDELWEDWNPAFHTPELKAVTQRAQRVVLRALESGLPV